MGPCIGFKRDEDQVVGHHNLKGQRYLLGWKAGYASAAAGRTHPIEEVVKIVRELLRSFFDAVTDTLPDAFEKADPHTCTDDIIDAAAIALAHQSPWHERLAIVGLSGPQAFWEAEMDDSL